MEIPVTFDTLFEQNGKRINCTVGDYFKQIIDRLEKVEKYGSASKHKVTLALMSQFRSVNMRFEELDLTYLREFEIFLRQRGNMNNSFATKFSVLKAVYNKAVSEGVLLIREKRKKYVLCIYIKRSKLRLLVDVEIFINFVFDNK